MQTVSWLKEEREKKEGEWKSKSFTLYFVVTPPLRVYK